MKQLLLAGLVLFFLTAPFNGVMAENTDTVSFNAFFDIHDSNGVFNKLAVFKDASENHFSKKMLPLKGYLELFSQPCRITVLKLEPWNRTVFIYACRKKMSEKYLKLLNMKQIKINETYYLGNRYSFSDKVKAYIKERPEVFRYKMPPNGLIGKGQLSSEFFSKLCNNEDLIESARRSVDSKCFDLIKLLEVRINDKNFAKTYEHISIPIPPCPESGKEYSEKTDESGNKTIVCPFHGSKQTQLKNNSSVYQKLKPRFDTLNALNKVLANFRNLDIRLGSKKNRLILALDLPINTEGVQNALNQHKALKGLKKIFQHRSREVQLSRFLPADTGTTMITRLPGIDMDLLWSLYKMIRPKWDHSSKEKYMEMLNTIDFKFKSVMKVSIFKDLLPGVSGEISWMDYPSNYSHFNPISGILALGLKETGAFEKLTANLSKIIQTMQFKVTVREYAGYSYYHAKTSDQSRGRFRRLPWSEIVFAVIDKVMVIGSSEEGIRDVINVQVGEKLSVRKKLKFKNYSLFWAIPGLEQYLKSSLPENIRINAENVFFMIQSGKGKIRANLVISKGGKE